MLVLDSVYKHILMTFRAKENMSRNSCRAEVSVFLMSATTVSHHVQALGTVYVVQFIPIVDCEKELGPQKRNTKAYQVQIRFLAQLNLFAECWVWMFRICEKPVLDSRVGAGSQKI